MKYIYVLLLLGFVPSSIFAQDSLETKPFRDHFTLDINGSIMFFPIAGTYHIPYNIHVSPGVKLSKHLSATISYSNFGMNAEYYTTRFVGYGIGLRYDRFPFLVKAELVQMTDYQNTRDWDSWYLRDKKNLNPMARLHIGFRVAPRFTLGVAYSHFRQMKVTGFNYSDELGDWTTFRKSLNDNSLQLFFGLSLGKREKFSK